MAGDDREQRIGVSRLRKLDSGLGVEERGITVVVRTTAVWEWGWRETG